MLVLLSVYAYADNRAVLFYDQLHLVSDRHCYDAGDRVWLRVFMTNSIKKQPIKQGEYVYVELIDNETFVHKRVMLKAAEDMYCGYVDIPKDIENGQYYLRAFTATNHNIAALESLVTIAIGEVTENAKTAGKADFTPVITSEQEGDSIAVYIDLGEACAALQSTFTIAVSTDSIDGNDIARSMARTMPEGLHRRLHPEMSQRITGSVTHPQGTRFTHPVDISLIAPLDNFFLTTRSDVNGNFAFENLELPDSTLLILQAMGAHENNELLLTIDTRSFPSCRYLNVDGEIVQQPLDNEDDDPFIDDNSIKLGNITVLGMYTDKEKRDAMSLMADESLSPDKIKEIDASNLRDLFRRISGVTFDVDGGLHIRSNNSIYGSNLATIAVDGVIMDGEFDLGTIPIGDVLRVDVFKSGTSVIWGADGGGGVISITTRAGSATDIRKRSPNIKKILAPGYQVYKPFTPAQGGPTTYWNPAIKTQGNQVLTLKVPAVEGSYITIQGLTSTGKTIHTHTKL